MTQKKWYGTKKEIKELDKKIKTKMEKYEKRQKQKVWVITAKEPKMNITHVAPFTDEKIFKKAKQRLKQKGWRNIKFRIMTKGEFEKEIGK